MYSYRYKLIRTLFPKCILFIIFAVLIILAPVLSHAADTTPPQLTDFYFSPTSIDVSSSSQNVALTLQVTDDIYGFSYGIINITSQSGNQTYSQEFTLEGNLISGNSTNGMYQVIVTFPQTSEAGTWHVTSIYLCDAANNEIYYHEPLLIQTGFPSTLGIVSVTGQIDDITPPSLKGIISITPAVVDTTNGPQQVTFTIHVTDDISGFSGGSIYVSSPTGKQTQPGSFVKLVSGNNLDGEYQATVTIPQFCETGLWNISYISIYDNAGNPITYYNNQLVQAGFPSTLQVEVPNTTPTADAGENVSIQSDQVSATTIMGKGTDPDQGDTLTYRWVEGQTTLLDWTPAGANGECPFSLASIPFTIGQHILNLEVQDSHGATGTDQMILTIGNSPPHAALKSGGGTYEIGTDVVLTGEASDFDGDNLSYEWVIDANPVCSGNISTIPGGSPVTVPGCSDFGLSLGDHTAYLQVNDGVNPCVTSQVAKINIIDNVAPTVAPVASRSILWPPNHSMVDITIDPHATDNSGGPVTLNATVSSNEPQDGLGDGDMSPDWTTPVIDQDTGIMTLELRAERSGSGNGRIYTINITATDLSGNSTTVPVKIIVPHDKANK